MTPDDAPFVSRLKWRVERPTTMVVCCSDGRLQEVTDDFLSRRGIQSYDRLYLPGGPGALASGGFEYSRADQHRRELRFLLEAHGTQELILLFHGSAADGPPEAVCADYRRKMPQTSGEEINARQAKDAIELLSSNYFPNLQVRAFRAEVHANNLVRFVSL